MTVVNTLIQTTLSLCSLRVTIPNHSHTFPNPLPGSYQGHGSALQLLSLLKHLNQHTGEEGDKHMLPSALRMERSREETRQAAVNSSKPQYHRKKPFFCLFVWSHKHSCACRDQGVHRIYLALCGQNPKFPGCQRSNGTKGDYSSPMNKSLETS